MSTLSLAIKRIFSLRTFSQLLWLLAVPTVLHALEENSEKRRFISPDKQGNISDAPCSSGGSPIIAAAGKSPRAANYPTPRTRRSTKPTIKRSFRDPNAGLAGAATGNLCFSLKNSILAVDARFCLARLLTPPEAGLPGRKTRELVLAYFGTANWNSILSRHDERSARRESGGGQTNGNHRRREVEFFLWTERGAGRWFFDIYIQGSKYNFKS